MSQGKASVNISRKTHVSSNEEDGSSPTNSKIRFTRHLHCANLDVELIFFIIFQLRPQLSNVDLVFARLWTFIAYVTKFSTVKAVHVLESIDVHRLSASTVRGASSGFLVSVGCFGLN